MTNSKGIPSQEGLETLRSPAAEQLSNWASDPYGSSRRDLAHYLSEVFHLITPERFITYLLDHTLTKTGELTECQIIR